MNFCRGLYIVTFALITGYAFAGTKSVDATLPNQSQNTTTATTQNPWYVDANAGYSNNVYAGAPTSWSGSGYGLNAGYMFNQYFGLEAGYFSSGTNEALGIAERGLGSQALDVAVKAVLPLANWFNVYGKLGIGYSKATMNVDTGLGSGSIDSHNGTMLAAGGVQFNLNENFGVHAEMDYLDQQFGNPLIPMNTFSELVGLEFRF